MKHIKTFESFLNENKSLKDLDMAVKQHEEGNPYYDNTKLINIYNQLSNKDQQDAKKKYPEVFGANIKK